MVARHGVYLDSTLGRVHSMDLNSRLLAVSRREFGNGSQLKLPGDLELEGQSVPFSHELFHDAWIFDGAIGEFDTDISISALGSGARLIAAAASAGLEVLNPYRFINVVQVNWSGAWSLEFDEPSGSPVKVVITLAEDFEELTGRRHDRQVKRVS